jgi:salicylate hydroxylase
MSTSGPAVAPPVKPKRISVIGGGLGGLAFAQAMKNVPNYVVTVYERDEAAEHRSQGYQIGIQGYGKESLTTLFDKIPGLRELLNENPLNAFVIGDSALDIYMKFPAGGKSLVNRWKLRDILKQDVDIEWNKRFSRYEETEDGVKAYFDDGTCLESDLLIAADGGKSRIRQQYRPDFKFQAVGVGSVAGFFEIGSPEIRRQIPIISAMVAGNLCRFLLNDRYSILCMRFIASDGKEQLLWALSFDQERDTAKFGPFPSGTNNHEAVKLALVQRLDEYCEEIKAVVRLTPAEVIMQPNEYNSMEPESLRYAHQGRPGDCPKTYGHVVLLGDAAHAMTTHAGLGANTAIMDAVELAAVIQDESVGLHTSRWQDGHARYEKDLFERGYKAVTESLSNTRRIHDDPSIFAIGFMRTVGFFIKTYNFVTTGTFGF